MLFNSLTFLIFLPIILIIYFRLGHRQQNILLLIASYIFYGWWDVRFLALLAISTVVDFHCARRMGRAETQKSRKLYMLASVFTNLSILGFFKYFNFFSDSIVPLLSSVGMEADMPTLDIILPLGISFYTFQSLSYTIDVYRRKLEPVNRFTDVALYVSFFPQLVAGPIERAERLLPQVRSERIFDSNQFIDGIWLIILGYLLKTVIADRCAVLVGGGFSGSTLPGEGLDTWMFVYAFAFQIYGDFAGYTCIARGVSRLFGFELMRNFAAPYFVTNPSEFWRHWHISLSTWLRDYLYIPLGGSKSGPVRTYVNLFITMVLGGLWHGAGWAFVIWGLYHGALLVAHRMFRPFLQAVAGLVPSGSTWRRGCHALLIVFYFHVTCIGWLIFRVGSLADGGRGDVNEIDFIVNSLGRMFSFSTHFDVDVIRYLLPLGILSMVLQYSHNLHEHFHDWPIRWSLRRPLMSQIVSVVFLLAAIAIFGVFSGTEFIYFQF